MVRRVSIALLVLAALSSPALAQPRAEVTVNFGWVFSDGVSGDAVTAGDGNIYNRIDPTDGATFNFTVGFLAGDKAEVGFLFGRQLSELEVVGTATRKVDDMAIDNYHGYIGYNFGESDAMVRPYVMFGLGATHYASLDFTGLGGQARNIPGQTRFSTTWGAGVKAYAGESVGVKLGVRWTPTYIKSDAGGWWCDPWWGCYVVGDAQYSNQFEFTGGVAFRFE